MVQQSGRDSWSESPRPGRWLAEGAHRRLRTGLTRCTFSYSPSLAGCPPRRSDCVSPRRATEPPGLLAWRLGRARRVPVVGRVGPPCRHVCRDRWPAPTCGPGREPRRTDWRCPATAAPGLRPQARGAAVGPPQARRTRRRGGAAVRGRVRPPATRRRLCVLLVDDVVAVEDGAALVAGQEHGDPFGDAGADQVAGGGASE